MGAMEPVFENTHFLLIKKRGGYLSVPSRMGTEDSRPCELVEWSRSRGILSPVHRLDEEVTGLLLFAKTKEAHRAANYWFETRQVKKTYEALTEKKGGSFPRAGEEFLWKSHLLRGKKRAYEKPFGKLAITRAQFVQEQGEGKHLFGLWKLSPETGRSHQLRYELFKFGCPVWGDFLYGACAEYPQPKTIALNAIRLDLHACENRRAFDLPEHFELPSICR